jgi:RNA-splicing ligase RtcB
MALSQKTGAHRRFSANLSFPRSRHSFKEQSRHRTDKTNPKGSRYMSIITGATLIAWGFEPGRHFKAAIASANAMRSAGATDDAIFTAIQAMVPQEITLRTNGKPFHVALTPENDAERANAEAVFTHMDALMRVPTIEAGAVMPDACPSGSAEGTIPVGGVVACRDAIHPGFHSADICCSVAISLFNRNDDPKKLLDAVQAITHFGPGGRGGSWSISGNLHKAIKENRFTAELEGYAINHMGTQGDGNHFAFVGHMKSSGQLALVTHHGSRGFGAQLYKRGMAAARKHTSIVAPKVPGHNAWIKADSDDGRAYWEALQVARMWTKENHFSIHDAVARHIGNRVADRWWNEHNFVFQKSDGLFYHGKGATPSWTGYSADDEGLTLIPLNMAEPVMIVRHKDNARALGFAPHGAGRNMGRKAFLRENRPELPAGIDARFYCGKPDHSELPEAYKNAAKVRAEIESFDLAEIVDEVLPYGSLMAGDWEQDAPWRKR